MFTVVGYETFAGQICELDDGTVIAPGQLLPQLSHADFERIVFDAPDRIIGVSQRRRFTGAVRRAIQVRDRHCQHPSGCDTPAPDCDADHITPHAHGGADRRSSTDASSAGPTTATHTLHDHDAEPPPGTPRSPTSTNSAPSCAGDSNTNTPTNGLGSPARRPTIDTTGARQTAERGPEHITRNGSPIR